MSRRLIGFQFANHAGANVAGDPDDPAQAPSYAVIPVAHMAAWAAHAPNFLLMPIFDGDVEQPAFIGPPGGWRGSFQRTPSVRSAPAGSAKV